MTKSTRTTGFYAYVLFRLNGIPCYVGKGLDDRWLHHEQAVGKSYSRNKHLARIIAKAGGTLPKIKAHEDLGEAEAFETEIALIKAIGRGKNGPLVNMTDGGDGQSGWVPSKETRARISAANMGKKQSEETRAKMSAAGKGRKKNYEHRQKIGAAHVGMTRSEEARAKMREASQRRWARPEEHAKLRDHFAAMTDEQRLARNALISATTRQAMTAEVCEKISVSRRAA